MNKIITVILASLICSSALAYGGTHWVGSYSRSNGTYVQGHTSGNPGSGVHCHDNVCE